MAIRLRFTTPAGHGQTNIDCGSVHGGRSHSDGVRSQRPSRHLRIWHHCRTNHISGRGVCHAHTHTNQHPHHYADSYGYPNCDRHPHDNGYAHGHTHASAYVHPNRHPDNDIHPYRHANADVHGGTHRPDGGRGGCQSPAPRRSRRSCSCPEHELAGVIALAAALRRLVLNALNGSLNDAAVAGRADAMTIDVGFLAQRSGSV